MKKVFEGIEDIRHNQSATAAQLLGILGYIILEVIKIPVLLLIGLESGKALLDHAAIHLNS